LDFEKVIATPLRYKPWRPRHLRLIVRDLFRRERGAVQPHRTHLEAAIEWLCRAQDARTGCADAGGVSAGWSFEDGWLPSYPETSGYIVETLLAASAALERPDLRARAQQILDWLLSLQQADGAFPGHFGEPGSRPVVFNTGQIMHGMLAGGLRLGREECLSAAVRAGHWLVRQQDADGCWRRHEHNDVPHTYNTRATWALLATGLVAGEKALVAAARSNLDWALAQQTANGWFEHNAFTTGQSPFTHTIAYAIRGFVECAVLLGDDRYLRAAEKAASAVADAQREDGSLPGALDRDWRASAGYCCLTGVAQIAINWLRLAQEGTEGRWLPHARAGLDYLKREQRVDDPDPIVRGAIAGSSPIWGDYSRFEFPNWAAKFFADALMMDTSGSPIPAVVTRTGRPLPLLSEEGCPRVSEGGVVLAEGDG
jgi:uncharacterized protein YyaL (SSP411 family)